MIKLGYYHVHFYVKCFVTKSSIPLFSFENKLPTVATTSLLYYRVIEMTPTLHPMTHFPQAPLSIWVSVSHSLSHTNEALVTIVSFSPPMSSTFQNLCVRVSPFLIYFMNEQ